MPPLKKRPVEGSFKYLFDLITAANKYDKFQLLNDPCASASNLDNSIHPILRSSNFEYGNDFENGDFIYEKMGQSLRLASMFLQHDSVLEWFVAPLLGRSLQSLHADGKSKQTYLSNPLANKSKKQKRELIDEVRRALHCLSNCVTFRFLDKDPYSYARTVTDMDAPPHKHTSACTKYFTSKHAVRIEIRPQYSKIFLDEYEESSRCKQFRHDFNFATVIIHEICHAVGVMRRGDMNEPYLRCDHPRAELGAAWENFMFGAIINPFDQDSDSIGFLMRRIWSDNDAAKLAGGKEWAAVPVSYIAQWFRKDTWDVISESGPAAIPPPHVDLKIISRTNSDYYAVYSDSKEKLRHIQAYKDMHAERYSKAYAANTLTISDIHGTFVDLYRIEPIVKQLRSIVESFDYSKLSTIGNV
ncbi:hypothetical protein K505DRAFT_370228 [Melanomma pulvis-pyrius CBS 109.77]|uniref:Uncharacterized protein n=1 Tax=Melanomma pulvis-pyrius CBS 109.77 TaxID=1314802 RepID=A0A6A6XV60_9PLEO|nr:hypothetical protein K505DRAFT_370228 [Melanomma pulvis-pyrius CBS 109.77]